MDFQTAVRTVLTEKYADFTGRARRSELWWFALFSFVVSLIAAVIDGALGASVGVIGALWSLAILIPSIAVGVRRLHDLGKSGWWYLLVFVPLIGALVLIYFFIQKGTDGPNQYGADPLA